MSGPWSPVVAAVVVAAGIVTGGGPAVVPRAGSSGATLAAAVAAPATAEAAGSPAGRVDEVRPTHGGLWVAGWAFDPDTTAPVAVHVYVDGTGHALRADQPSPAVEAAFPGVGPDHAFGAAVPVAPGAHRVCVYALNVGPGETAVADCRDVTVTDGPVGLVDDVRPVRGAVVVTGWAFDPDTTGPIPVHVYVDDAGHALTADGPSPAVEAAFGEVGPDHAYAATLPASPGPHRVCVYALNVGPGTTTVLECRGVTVPVDGPVGRVDEVRLTSTGLLVSGWAYDEDTTDPIDVHVYVDGARVPLRADGASPAVEARFPGVGPAHAFTTTSWIGIGDTRVCVYAINVGPGETTLLDCRTVSNGTAPGSPVGRVTERFHHPRLQVTFVSGWVFDPDTVDPIRVSFSGNETVAGGATPWLEETYPGVGAHHGFGGPVHDPGECVRARNIGPGADTLLC